jgi:hypothetical protein
MYANIVGSSNHAGLRVKLKSMTLAIDFDIDNFRRGSLLVRQEFFDIEVQLRSYYLRASFVVLEEPS